MDKEELIKKVGKFCYDFRKNDLKLSLKEFAEITGLNNKNINAFEYGRANSIHYLFYYYRLCNDSLKNKFCKDLFNIL